MFAVSFARPLRQEARFASDYARAGFGAPTGDAFERFFRDLTVAPEGFAPRLSFKRHEAGFELRVALAGIAREAVSLNVTDRVLEITVKPQSVQSVDGAGDVQGAAWEKHLSLPQDVDPEAISAKFENGLLVVQLGLYAKPAARRITIA